MNQPSRAEKFVLPDGVRKLTFTRDTKVANAGTFIVQKEDHTLGNTVRMQLHRDPNVVFAGYQVPHPSDNRIIVKVRAATAPPTRRRGSPIPSRAFRVYFPTRRPPPRARTAADPRANPPNPQVHTNKDSSPMQAMTEAVNHLRTEVRPRDDDDDETRLDVGHSARCMRRAASPPTTDLPLRLSPIHQVSDLSDKFKDEVAAFKSNQGGY